MKTLKDINMTLDEVNDLHRILKGEAQLLDIPNLYCKLYDFFCDELTHGNFPTHKNVAQFILDRICEMIGREVTRCLGHDNLDNILHVLHNKCGTVKTPPPPPSSVKEKPTIRIIVGYDYNTKRSEVINIEIPAKDVEFEYKIIDVGSMDEKLWECTTLNLGKTHFAGVHYTDDGVLYTGDPKLTEA